MHPTTKLNVISFISCSPVSHALQITQPNSIGPDVRGAYPDSNMATLQTLVSDSLSRRFIDCDWAKNQ